MFKGVQINKMIQNNSEITKTIHNGITVYQKATSPIGVYDSFNRADANTLGVADTGQSWLVDGGTFGIVSNMARPLSLTNSFARAVIDSGLSNCIVSVKINMTEIADSRVLFRYIDSANHFFLHAVGSSYILYRRVSGATTNIGSINLTNNTKDDIKIALNGNNIKVYINNTLIFNITDSTYLTATKHGIAVYNTLTARFDDFKVEVLA